MNHTLRKLSLSCSGIALLAVLAAPSLGLAQTTSIAAASAGGGTDPSKGVEVGEVVVTGTSLRGVAPVGSNLMSVGAEDIRASGQSTITGALQTVPALTGMGATGQGGTAAFYQPSIHSLGASASNSTLVLIDGHRGPTGGTNHTFLDPNIIPMTMLERIDVLAEGASATYGSDAVAGVVNFITRKHFDGLQVEGQTVLMDGSTGYTLGLVTGKTWDTGAFVLGYSHIDAAGVKNTDRSWTNPDQRSRGGTNFQTFNCAPATLQPGGAGPIFLGATSGQGVTNAAANAPCSDWSYADRVGDEVRDQVMAKITQQLTDNLTVGVDLLYARRRNDAQIGAGTVQATAYGAGPQANPFYSTPSGYTGTATSETIRWDATSLLGPAHSLTGSNTMYGSFTASQRLTDNWNVDFLGAIGRDVSNSYTVGTINGSMADLALNGTTNSGGNPTAVSIPGSNTVVLQLPLTAANALDVWNPASTNRTSAAVRQLLLDNANMLQNTSGFRQARAIVNGALFDLPAGAVKVAVGGELLHFQLDQFVARANNSGPASLGSQQLNFSFNREVRSAFGELNVPVISPDMNVPLMRGLDLNLSYRYDHYSDFGSTTNPRYAFNWDVVDGLRFRGNYSTSFVAPPLTILGDQHGAFGTAGWNAVSNNVPVPVAAYPALTQLGIPGCTSTSVTCNISSLQGVQVTSGNHDTGAQQGKGWSLGFDYSPEFLPGLHTQVTYWNTSFNGGVTGPNLQNVINTGSANFLLTLYPNCATAAQLAQFTQGIPQRTTAPGCTSYIFRSLNSNWLNLHVEGVDYSIQYRYRTDDLGDFTFGLTGTQFVKYTQAFGSGQAYSILNTTGNNGTFPSVATQARGRVGWVRGPLAADLFANFTGSYKNWSGTSVIPITRDANGNPAGGGDPTKSNTTFDLNVGYTFSVGPLKDAVASLSVLNLTDKTPPFYNSAVGYDTFVANPFGRRITLGLRMKIF